MKQLLSDPAVIMMLSILVVEGVQIVRFRRILAKRAVAEKLSSEEKEFIKFVQVVTDGYTA